ncbi:Probable TonB-dependent outer membrane receptor precursor [Flavobacterium indicum GPTSA100-9 = DSM 17447]|uniref:Probable TonB-dependent outer membrane receptor n=2 Tax=Flavobacterium TaxID=237 RepID=H8XPX0_FLAIG|nr:TonB-dependent receptor [Flavobacterium indicum]CCG54186.1 Probable TonB-dependent outer membrane receptor precursor [Flavobacterium indicum GPTSA100-9 = DSM 17447]
MFYRILIALLLPLVTIAQSSITGKIVNANNQPISNAKISVIEQNNSFYTDESGNFSLIQANTDVHLIIEANGYKKMEVKQNCAQDFVLVVEQVSSEKEIEAVVVKKEQKAMNRSVKAVTNTINLSQKELQKAACCNLSESFETNPSIDVNFSDAVTGNKQIKMLGLTSPYILMSEENIPAIRGALQATGLNFIPGTWVESIQITKGAGSVTNGYESISGQINYELLKPIKEVPFYTNAYASNDGRYELNTHFKTKFSEKLSSLVLLHGNTRNQVNDMNQDGFMDNPQGKQINLLNRWQYNDAEKGLVSFFNIKYFKDEKTGGQVGFSRTNPSGLWGSQVDTEKLELSNKIGYVFPDMPFQSIGFQQAFQYNKQNSLFGTKLHEIKHKSYFSNLLFNSILNNTKNKFITGVNFTYDKFEENVVVNFTRNYDRIDNSVGAFFEYSYDNLNNLSFVLGARVDNHNRLGTFFTPRAHLKYIPFERTTIRVSAGRGKRAANIFAENINLLASSREIIIQDAGGKLYGLNPEIAWNYGLSLNQKFNLFGRQHELVLDYYKTDFQNQVVVDLENPQQVTFSNLNGKSYAASFQAELNFNILTHLDIRTAYKYLDVKTDFQKGLLEKPLQAKHRFFANVAYETHIKEKGQQWKFDATFNWIGEQRLPNTKSNPINYQLGDYTKPYEMFNAQVTRTFSSVFEMYVGGENLGNFRQNNAIIASDNPFNAYFDSTMIYGPVFGRMFYAGLRFKIK